MSENRPTWDPCSSHLSSWANKIFHSNLLTKIFLLLISVIMLICSEMDGTICEKFSSSILRVNKTYQKAGITSRRRPNLSVPQETRMWCLQERVRQACQHYMAGKQYESVIAVVAQTCFRHRWPQVRDLFGFQGLNVHVNSSLLTCTRQDLTDWHIRVSWYLQTITGIYSWAASFWPRQRCSFKTWLPVSKATSAHWSGTLILFFPHHFLPLLSAFLYLYTLMHCDNHA